MIVGGMILCSAAEDIALTDNYTLFHTSENGETYVRHDFNDADISKIELLLTDATVQIISGAEESYIEFINFRDGLYTLSTSGKVISLDEIPDLKSIFSMESGFSFSGLRYILRAGTASLGDKRVNVYLTQDAALKILSVEAENCTFVADNLHTACDIQLHVTDSLSATIAEARTGSKLEISAAIAALSLSDSTFNAVKITAQTAEIAADSLVWERMTLQLDSGDATLYSAVPLAWNAMRVTGSGALYLDGEETDLPLYEDAANLHLTAEIGAATLRLYNPDDALE